MAVDYQGLALQVIEENRQLTGLYQQQLSALAKVIAFLVNDVESKESLAQVSMVFNLDETLDYEIDIEFTKEGEIVVSPR